MKYTASWENISLDVSASVCKNRKKDFHSARPDKKECRIIPWGHFLTIHDMNIQQILKTHDMNDAPFKK